MIKREKAESMMNELGGSSASFLFLIDFDMEEAIVLPPGEAAAKNIFYDFHGETNCPRKLPPNKEITLKKTPLPYREYLHAFEAVQSELRRGNSYLLNLTFPTPIECDRTLSQIFHLSRAKYRLLFQNRFVCFSPEIFVQIRDGTISTYPMKGTIDAKIENAEERILSDEKEMAEHTTVVDLLRNDLSMVAKRVRVERFRYIDRIQTHEKELLQVSSHISGELPSDYPGRIGSILFSMLPAGSVTGAPKKKSVAIIKAAEGYERGFYTGVAGLFDGKSLDSCVMIRFIEQSEQGLTYKSGGGITLMSDPQAEYQELIDKIYVPLI